MGNCRTETAGAEAGFLPLAEALWRGYSSGQPLRALKGRPCSGSPCKEGSRCCWCWTGRGGEGAPRAGALFGEEPGSAGAADARWGPEGLGCCRSGSPRSSAASGGHTGAAPGRRSLRAASYAGTMQPTAARRAAPVGRRREKVTCVKMRVEDRKWENKRARKHTRKLWH